MSMLICFLGRCIRQGEAYYVGQDEGDAEATQDGSQASNISPIAIGGVVGIAILTVIVVLAAILSR